MSPGILLTQSSRLSVSGASSSATVSGSGTTFDFAIGATVGGGAAIAADVGVANANADITNDATGQNGTTTQTRLFLGAIVDWYVVPTGGFHVQAGIGTERLAVDGLAIGPIPSQSGTASTTATVDALSGFGGLVGIGYEGWVSPRWSIGGLFRLDAASVATDVQGTHVQATTIAPSLRVSFTYN